MLVRIHLSDFELYVCLIIINTIYMIRHRQHCTNYITSRNHSGVKCTLNFLCKNACNIRRF